MTAARKDGRNRAEHGLLLERPMEIQNGFIVGIFNYCDSWCAACAFTSRCRVFADMAEEEGAADPNLRAIVEAPLLPQDIPPPPPEWMQELLEEMNKAAREATTDTKPEPRPQRQILPEHEGLREHAEAYFDCVYTWLRTHDVFAEVSEPDDPRAVVKWFYSMIYVKVRRALHGLAEDDPAGRDWPADHDGSAKVALLAVERSQAAWLHIIERGLAKWDEAEPFIRQLLWLREEIERVFPNARAFVRPGFDEPDEVAILLAAEGV
jgi:hypothetical protein